MLDYSGHNVLGVSDENGPIWKNSKCPPE